MSPVSWCPSPKYQLMVEASVMPDTLALKVNISVDGAHGDVLVSVIIKLPMVYVMVSPEVEVVVFVTTLFCEFDELLVSLLQDKKTIITTIKNNS